MPALPVVRATPTTVALPVQGRRRRLRPRRAVYVLPLGVFLVLMAGYPLEQLLRMSFSNVTITTLQHAWALIGLQNYRDAFTTPVFSQAVGHTLIFVALVSGVGMLGGLTAALVLRG
ncbi:MAG TPA: hypothetical protein VEJ84_12740, partial [Acidimicrobiales bacterium]|nr:hypothetical protein [Acidimicrobiales bacterium]